MYRQVIKRAVSLNQSALAARFLSSDGGKLINVEVNDKTGIALVSLNRPPVNSLNIPLLKEIKTTIDDLESNRSKGMILSTTSKSVFSAGLDIMEMYQQPESHLREFWTGLQDMWLKLFSANIPVAAAISGHSPAGGCLISMSCDYRVMCPGFNIGLNETQLGLVAPEWFQDTMKHILPSRIAEASLLEGKMFKTDEALKVGLIDEIANDKEDAINKATAFIMKFQKVPTEAYAFTKQTCRKRILQRLEDNREQDVQLFLFSIQHPKTQKGLDMYVQALKNKKQK